MNPNEEDLIRAVNADGVVVGKPIEILEGGSFSVNFKVPPLYRPEVEVLVETFGIGDATGGTEELFRATLGQRAVRIGPVEVVLKNMSGTATSKDAAVSKLTSLVGKAVVQAYFDLLVSGDQAKVDAAKSMEIGS